MSKEGVSGGQGREGVSGGVSVYLSEVQVLLRLQQFELSALLL